MFHHVWGHSITDNIRRLWFLKSDIFQRQFKNCKLVYIDVKWPGRDDNLVKKHFRQILDILDINYDFFLPIESPTKFEKIILPDESFSFDQGLKFTDEYRELIERVRNFALKNRTPVSNKKLYFYHGRRQTGEERLAEYFKSKGYKIITHEQRADLDEELNLLINCEIFASTLGSCAHNSVFLRDGTEAIFIPRNYRMFNLHQNIINQVNSLNVYYIDSSLSIFCGNTYAFLYVLSEQLKKFFGDKWEGYTEEDFKAFLQYVKNCNIDGLVVNPNAKKFYGKVFGDFMAQLKRRKDLIDAYEMPPHWETFQPMLTYQTHVHMRGWGDGWKFKNEPSNPLDQMLDVLAIRINFPGHKVYYSVYFNEKEGWSKEVASPGIAGTVGICKPIYGMRIWLDEAGQKEFDILYRMHKFDDTWTPWAKNGENLYSYAVKVNAIQIKLEPIKAEPDKVNVTESEYAQKFLAGRDETIYLQVQRQDLNQIK